MSNHARAVSLAVATLLTLTSLPAVPAVTTSSSSPPVESAAPESASVENAYIKIVVGDYGPMVNGTTGGDPTVLGDEDKPLLYGFPYPSGTGFPSARILTGGTITDYRLSEQAPIQGPTVNDDTIFVVWAISGVEIRQETGLAHNPYTGRSDTTRIAYTVTNNDGQSHDVGIRLMLDIQVGGNDLAPFFVPGTGNTDQEQEYTAANVPPYFKSFESDTYAGDSLKSMGILDGFGADVPDRFVLATWSEYRGDGQGISDTVWDYTVTPGANIGDSAAAWWWNPVSLSPGQSKTFVTYYGLASTGGGGNWIDAPVVVDCEQRDFHADLWIVNNTATPYQDGRSKIDLPAGLHLADGERMTVDVGDVAADGGVANVGWNLRADGTVEGTVTFTATTTFTGKTIVTTREIAIPLCLDIIQPIKGAQVQLGPFSVPDRQLVIVTNKPAPGLGRSDFRVWIGDRQATVINVSDTGDGYRIVAVPPAVASEGVYDLTVEANVGAAVAANARLAWLKDIKKDAALFGPGRVSWVLVLDHTGSMKTWCLWPFDFGKRKFDRARTAADAFADLLADIRGTDRLGVVRFTSRLCPSIITGKAHPATTVAPLAQITGAHRRLIANRLNALGLPDGCTPIHWGLEAGRQMLQPAAAGRRIMILLSDGEHNTPRCGWGCDSRDPRPVQDEVKEILKQKITVHSIGFSVNGQQNVRMLRNTIAIPTGGRYWKQDELCWWPVSAMSGEGWAESQMLFSDLTGAYLDLLEEYAGRRLLFEQQDTLSSGATGSHAIQVDPASQATFYVTWPNVGAGLGLTLQTPGGAAVTPASAAGNPDVTYLSGETYAYYRIKSPQVGVWTAQVGGGVVDGQPYALHSTGKAPLGDMPIFLDPRVRGGGRQGQATTDKPLIVTASLVDTAPVGATIVATVTLPDGTQVELRLYDDGYHSDGAAGDGLYANTIAPPLQQGIYDVTIIATGVDGAGNPFQRVDHDAIQVVPPLNVEGGASVETVGSSQGFNLTFFYENASDETMVDVTLQAQYDPNVVFVSADPPPDAGNDTWNLGALAPGEYAALIVTVRARGGLSPGTVISSLVQVLRGGTPVDNVDVDLTVAGAPADLEVGAGPATLFADGTSEAELWVEIFDSAGRLAPGGQRVTMQTDHGTFPGGVSTYVVISENGVAFAPLVATTPGTATVTIDVDGVSAETQVRFIEVWPVALPLILRDFQAGQAVVPTPSPTVPPTPLFFDDFTDPSSGWWAWEDDDLAFDYNSGNYRIQVKRASLFVYPRAPSVTCADCSIEVEAWRSTGGGSRYGILFGYSVYSEFYAFVIRPDEQEYYLRRYDRGSWVTLIPSTYSPFINSGYSHNRLKVMREGSQIRLYVNDHYLVSYPDSTYTGERMVGVIARSMSEAPVWLRYDDFTVWGPGHATMSVGVGEDDGVGVIAVPPD
jgi:hypothetical protein